MPLRSRAKRSFRAAAAAIVVACAVQSAPPAAPKNDIEPQFRFQSNFWVNLHHLLRGDSRRKATGLPLSMKLDSMTEPERDLWSSALAAYSELANKNLVFDAGLIRINNALAQVPSDSALPSGVLESEAIVAALSRGATIYRNHGWSEQAKVNEPWIASLRPLMEGHAQAMIAALEKVYNVKWPMQPILVDASEEAGPVGGYTTGGPPGTAAHTVIEAANEEYRGSYAFEMVFHEASHAEAIESRIRAMIDGEAEKEHLKPHEDLWHAMIFYTTGELTRRELAKDGDKTYEPVADRFGVYDRGWKELRASLERDWKPYLDGRVELKPALARLIRESSKPAE